RIVAAFDAPFDLAAGEHFAKVSVGVAIASPPGSTPTSLLRDADAALYQAKAKGRARSEVFNQAMHARTVARLSIENDLRRALDAADIDPSSLCLEITESVLMREPEAVSKTVQRVAALGVRFLLDDFGTGYSSLAYLGELPIDGVKIDRSFVQTLNSSERTAAITRAID